MERVKTILNVWFGDPEDPTSDYGSQRRAWFQKSPEFDDLIRDRFLDDYTQAAAGQLDHWQDQPRSCLALILLLDQFPRNLFRQDPRSFATDAQALAVAEGAIAQGFDQVLIPVERLFIYLPLEHSENLHHQQRCVQLVQSLGRDHPELASTVEYAIRHHDIIERFGRFPHRNAILGRETTPEEAAFLEQPSSRF